MPRIMKHKTTYRIIHAARQNRHELTPAEQILWEALRDRRLQGLKFRKQHPVGGYVLDFFCVEELLAVEVDGGSHDLPEQQALDAERTEWLNQHHIRVLRFSNAAITDQLPAVLDEIHSFVINHALPK